jgi:hypothetical protein
MGRGPARCWKQASRFAARARIGPRDVDCPVSGGHLSRPNALACFTLFSTWMWERWRASSRDDLSDAGVGGDQLVAAAELFLPFGGPFAVAGVQRLVPDDGPQIGDLVVPRAEVE